MVSQYMLEGIEVTKAGTPDQTLMCLVEQSTSNSRKLEPGFNSRLIAQTMYNDLRDSYDDYKFVFTSSNRFWEERVGVLGLIDLEEKRSELVRIGSILHQSQCTVGLPERPPFHRISVV